MCICGRREAGESSEEAGPAGFLPLGKENGCGETTLSEVTSPFACTGSSFASSSSITKFI